MDAERQLLEDIEQEERGFLRLELGQGASLVVSASGGRVFGPFMDGNDPLGWCPDRPEFARMLREHQWNIGGERVWLAPEGLFNFTDPNHVIETYRVDPSLDPGSWRLERRGAGCLLSLDADVALASGTGSIGVRISRTIEPFATNAAVGARAVAGYRQRVEVRQTGGETLPLVPWIIRQVAPGGMAFASASDGGTTTAIFGDPPRSALKARDGHWQVDMSGPGFYKVACHRDAIGRGDMGYLKAFGANTAFAVLCQPVLAVASAYPETLPLDRAATGQAAALFYDSGRFGAYGELELYGHRTPAGRGVLETDCLLLRGAAAELRQRIGLADD
ncbi:hypothetical protein OSH11_07130 [Kaistia dalseonensis]|uniref:Uncharacterized protein n=1 Tax=Kaistia dalseonensis TaxID=410840 RepID=A0ABU0H415_9HYPH|nr:hypothetical protein [Kaistia dalseonensis]MCX5494467.1 hypothetical protein [Kaistia dalseonensis]MDQ0437046.1 hypothetical protein [Kaistia dalseonensis]